MTQMPLSDAYRDAGIPSRRSSASPVGHRTPPLAPSCGSAVVVRLLPGDLQHLSRRKGQDASSAAELEALEREAARARSDLQLLLRIAQPAVILLTPDLQARWFTPEVRAFVDDWDRSFETLLEALTRSCGCEDLIDVANRVVDEKQALEFEAATSDDRILRFRLLPYDDRDPDREGVVLGIREITRYRRLERQIAEISEAERRRIGEDLHDMIASRLTAVSMRLQNLRYSLVEQDRPVTAADLDTLIEEVRRGANEARTLSHALVPVPLYESSLAGALQRLAKEINNLHSPTCLFEGDTTEPLPENTTTGLHLYRIAYEAVQNAIQHAEPDTIRIRLERDDDTLILSVADDGSGLPDEDLDEGTDEDAPGVPESGLGLHLMQYRADLIGADLRFRPGSEGGTVLECAWPIQDDIPSPPSPSP